MPASCWPILQGINHPLFSCISPTTYTMQDPDYSICTTIHVGQLAEYLQFNEELCTSHDANRFKSIPIGFAKFGNLWNAGVSPSDDHHISRVFLYANPDHNTVNPSYHPVQLQDFHITPTQAGLATTPKNQPSSTLQADINHEFTALTHIQVKHLLC